MKTKMVLFLFVLCTMAGSLSGQMNGNQNATQKVAILDVVDKEGNIPYAIKLLIRSKLTAAITYTPGYEGYDRVDLASIMDEQKFQRTGMVSDAEIKKIGLMTGAAYVLVTECAMYNSTYIINAKILEVETAKVERTADAMCTGESGEIEKGSKELAAKLLERVPKGGTNVKSNSNTGVNSNTHRVENQSLGNGYTETAWGIDMQMVYVEGGNFLMGCTAEQGNCNSDAKDVMRVTVDSYYIGKFEVSQSQWEKVMGSSVVQMSKVESSKLPGIGADYPMYYVNWMEASAFCEELSRKTGKKYRLPTEAEWEYAARGGNQRGNTQFSGSALVDVVAWYDGNSDKSTHQVGTKRDNLLGLCDMSGNVGEWCMDWYADNYGIERNNPKGPSEGYSRVCRGGSWRNRPSACRVSTRSFNAPGYRANNIGFRVVCEP